MKKTIRRSVQRRKVAFIASRDRKYTVNNCTIKKANLPKDYVIYKDGNGEWKEEKHPQRKRLRHAKKVWQTIYWPDGVKQRVVKARYKSEYPDYTIKKLNKQEFMEAYAQDKLKKWVKKHPCPVKTDSNTKDLFEKEYLIPWERERDLALERIRDFVVSVYDKLSLTGRYKKNENKFEEKPVAKIKDINGEGHKVNELDPKNSKLLKKAQKITNDEHKKNKRLVCTNLKDHKKQRGRIILPKAA